MSKCENGVYNTLPTSLPPCTGMNYLATITKNEFNNNQTAAYQANNKYHVARSRQDCNGQIVQFKTSHTDHPTIKDAMDAALEWANKNDGTKYMGGVHDKTGDVCKYLYNSPKPQTESEPEPTYVAPQSRVGQNNFGGSQKPPAEPPMGGPVEYDRNGNPTLADRFMGLFRQRTR